MIKLRKGDTPQVIVDHGEEWTLVWVDHVRNGTPINESAKGRHRHPEIKRSVRAETHDKCAYCESKVTHVYPGDVEHILPKRKHPELYVVWNNLTFGCSVCNNKKRDYSDESQPLLDPYADDPDEHLVFHGPLILHVPGSTAGETTRLLLDLSRTPLFERRQEKIESLKRLIDRWVMMEEGALRELLLDEIKTELGDDREFAAALRAFARDHAGIEP